MTIALVVLVSIAGLALGPALALLGRRFPFVSRLLEILTIGLVPVMIVVRFLPHLYESSGWMMLALATAGLVAAAVAGHRHGFGEGHAHAHSIVVPALAVHSLLDGTAISLTFTAVREAESVFLLAAALVLHRIPEGLFVVSTLGGDLRKALPRIALIAGATIAGAVGGAVLFDRLPHRVLDAFVAFGLGIMLCVVLQRSRLFVGFLRARFARPQAHGHSTGPSRPVA